MKKIVENMGGKTLVRLSGYCPQGFFLRKKYMAKHILMFVASQSCNVEMEKLGANMSEVDPYLRLKTRHRTKASEHFKTKHTFSSSMSQLIHSIVGLVVLLTLSNGGIAERTATPM